MFLFFTKIVLATTIQIATVPSAADQLAMDRFRTTNVEFAREAMAEADAIDAEIVGDETVPGWRYQEMPESPKAAARTNGSFCQMKDGAF